MTRLQKRADGLFTFAILIGGAAGIAAWLAPAAAIPLVLVSIAGIVDAAIYRHAALRGAKESGQ